MKKSTRTVAKSNSIPTKEAIVLNVGDGDKPIPYDDFLNDAQTAYVKNMLSNMNNPPTILFGNDTPIEEQYSDVNSRDYTVEGFWTCECYDTVHKTPDVTCAECHAIQDESSDASLEDVLLFLKEKEA